MARRYPQEVHDFIRENVQGRTAAELADMVNAAYGTAFTPASMKSYKQNRKLKSGTPHGRKTGGPTQLYPAEIRAYIRDNLPGVGPKEMTERLNAKFGTSYTRAQITAFYKNNGLNSGVDGRFQPGHVPANKGKKGWSAPGTEATRFKPGHQPANKMPIGTIAPKFDGYLWKKIGEGAREWRQLHRIVWEEAHGPIPPGYMVEFKDGNRENCALENLALVSKGEHGVMNRKGLRFSTPEAFDTGLLIAKVKIAAGKRKRKEAEHGTKD